MTDISQVRDELIAVTRDLAESFAYLRELGVDSLPAADAPNAKAPTRREAEQPPGAQAAYRHHSSALERHARHEATAAATTTTTRVSTTSSAAATPPSSTGARPSENASTLPQDQTEMAKRPTRRAAPAPATPAPRETLFGEITPMDESSLPRPGETLADIHTDIGECIRCPLSQTRTHVVNSEGNARARLMFVGEAPGADEDAQARPFVGRAGQLLNKIIEAIGLKREDIFIGNVNRCRPPQNRTPTPQEAATCKPFLLREIAVVKPDVIVVLGNTAMKNLLDTKEGITKLRGNFQDYNGIKVMPTFHPAYLLRDPSKKRETWDDMKKVRDYLNETKPGPGGRNPQSEK